MTTQTIRHVVAVPIKDDWIGDAILVGKATTLADALRIVQDAGYRVVAEDKGGNCDEYDADDAPDIFGYEADGLGAFGITVEA